MRTLSRLQGGVIVPPNVLELPIADHCNLTCRDCSHASPALPRWFADPDQMGRDLTLLARFYRPRRIKVLGGEPLLHKNLYDLLAAARASGICESFYITTNGSLLERMDSRVWSLIEEVEISNYPGALTDQMLSRAQAQARHHGVALRVNNYRHFNSTLSLQKNPCSRLVEEIYATCQVVYEWGCHTVRHGVLYKCPRSAYVPRLTAQDPEGDGFTLEPRADFQAALLEYLNSPLPLKACHYCVGTVGKSHPHQMQPRPQWQASLNRPVEELVDREKLARALAKLER